MPPVTTTVSGMFRATQAGLGEGVIDIGDEEGVGVRFEGGSGGGDDPTTSGVPLALAADTLAAILELACAGDALWLIASLDVIEGG
jgi:hypothetical protein